MYKRQAIEIPQQIRTKINSLQNKLKKEFHNVKWVEEKNLHLTLKFLGEIDEIEPIVRTIKKILAQIAGFEASLAGLGGFPQNNRARVIWIGVNMGETILAKLMEDLDRELVACGIPAESRKKVPHLTIGRVRRGFIKLPDYEFESDRFPVKELVLFKSTLTPQGPIYEPLKKFSL